MSKLSLDTEGDAARGWNTAWRRATRAWRACWAFSCVPRGASTWALRNGRRERREQIPGERVCQAPGDRHGELAVMLDVRRGSKKVERAFVAALPREEHDAGPSLRVALITLTGLTGRSGHRLALPVDEIAADRVVTVARRG